MKEGQTSVGLEQLSLDQHWIVMKYIARIHSLESLEGFVDIERLEALVQIPAA